MENKIKTEEKMNFDALYVITLALSLLMLLCLFTGSLVFGSFGLIINTLVLGVFGYAAFGLFLSLALFSILKLIGKKVFSSGSFSFLAGLIIFSTFCILQVLTSDVKGILAGETSFYNFVNLSYKLQYGGIFGASFGGALFASIIYYPMIFLKQFGFYIVFGLLIAVSILGIVLVSLKHNKYQNNKLSNSSNRNRNVGGNRHNSDTSMGSKVKFGSKIDDLESRKNSNYKLPNIENNGDDYDNDEEYYDDDVSITKKRSAGRNSLFISNAGKTSNFPNRPKREYETKVERNTAFNTLYPEREERIESTKLNSHNSPKKLSNDRKIDDFDNRININENVNFDNFRNSNNEERPSLFSPKLFEKDDTEFVKKRTDVISDSSFRTKVNIEPKEKEIKPEDKFDFDIKKKKDDDIEMFKTNLPKVPPKILTSQDVKSKVVEKNEPKKDDEKQVISLYDEKTKELENLFDKDRNKNYKVNMDEINSNFKKEEEATPKKVVIYKSVDQLTQENKRTSEAPSEVSTASQMPIISRKTEYDLNEMTKEVFEQSFLNNPKKVIGFKDEPKVEIPDIIDTGIKTSIFDFGDEGEANKFVSKDLVEPKPIIINSNVIANQIPIKVNAAYNEPAKKEIPKINYGTYNFPSMELLKKSDGFYAEITPEIEQKAALLENILDDFKVPAKVMDIIVGPTVTKFELEMPQGVTVKKVEQYAKDISLWLKSPTDVIIQAPIPGKNRLGIEVPNEKKSMVHLRDVLESEQMSAHKSPLAFALGKDVSGANVICDIKKTPHLLIAGATGMGKSVCLNTIIMSIIFHAKPEDVRLILIDPKKVEFNIYKGIPHLMIDDIVCENDKAIATLSWAIDEMERRYTLFQYARQKDLDSYNAFINPEETKKLPRIVIIVDELADLMMVNRKELEEKIMRLTQKARAAGIHLILATQRPSVDIITGVIKTNLPSRISFKLSNGMDSKTVLDEVGAEKLLGNGDMFYKPGDSSIKNRVQGAFISMSEVESVVEYVIANNKPEYDEFAKEKIFAAKEQPSANIDSFGNEEEFDDVYIDALRAAIETGQMSITMLQRRFSLGYVKAGKMIDSMERNGYVSSFNGSKPREVLISREQFEDEFGEF